MQAEQPQSKMVYSFPKCTGEEIQIAVRKYQGKYYIDLRQWFESRQQGGELKPTKKGVIFPMERLPEFKEGVDKLLLAWDKIPTPAVALKR